MTVGRPLLCVALLLCALRPASLAAQRTEMIRGRVIGDSGRVVANATVIVTRGPDRLVQQAVTSDSGRYVVTFENGTGDYLVAVSATGFRPARRRVTRVAEEREFTADFVLTVAVATLDAMQINANRPVRASTGVAPTQQETGASERWNEGVVAALPPSMAGDISTTVSAIPGSVMGPGGMSMLGASASSNLTTLNGMAMGAGSVPRAARVDTRVTGATFDATRGGFSGANVDLRLAAGSRDFQNRNLFLTSEAPALQSTDAIGRALGATNSLFRASAGMDGEAIRSALTYNVAVDVARTTRPLNDLTAADPLAYQLSGVSTDSVLRARQIALNAGLPLQNARVPRGVQRDALNVLARFDDTRDSTWSRSLTTYVSNTQNDNDGTSPLQAAIAGAERTERAMGGILSMTHWSGPGLSRLRATRLNANRTTTRTTPYADGPAVDVLVRTVGDVTATDAGLASLGVGSRGFAEQASARWTAEANHEFTQNIKGRTHLVKAIAWGRVDGVAQESAESLGRYGFNSLADLAANRPNAYSRLLVNPDREGRAWNTATAISHTWNKSRFFSLIYGARVEGNGFLGAPARNPALESALGVHTGGVSPRLRVSPRVGFTYSLNKARNNGSGSSYNSYGTWYRYPTGVLRGGIGEFRDLWRPDVMADVAARTGLPGSTLALTCIGAAVPRPDFRSVANLPTQCLDGSGVLGERAPSVSLLDRDYDAPRSWRASLDYNTARWTMIFRASALATLDRQQPSIIDRNFAGTPRFTLASENNRAVFVTPTAIDPGTGAVSAADSRRSTDYGRVSAITSDLEGRGAQLTMTAGLDRFNRRWRGWPFMTATYTLQRVDRQQRGFDGAALGDPRLVEWAPASTDARHVWLLQAGVSGKLGTVAAFARLQSGLPFTPLVQGDVNGDGRGGDRAVIANASGAVDAALRGGLRALEQQGSATARACVAASLARPGERNGCRGPWTQTLNASWSLPTRFNDKSWWNRVAVSVFANNVLGGIDQLVRGANNMRGWGGVPLPDPVLLVPRGFDAGARAFRYDVNPRFAETRPSRSSWREPFRLTMDVSIRLSTDYDLQSLRRAVEPVRMNGKWQRQTVDSLQAQYLRRTSSIHRILVSEGDTLLLTPPQVAQLQQLDSVFSADVRAMYRQLAEYLAAQPEGVASKAAVDSVSAVNTNYWAYFWKQPELAAAVLNSQQIDVFGLLKDMLTIPLPQRKGQQHLFGNNVPLVHAVPQVRKN